MSLTIVDSDEEFTTSKCDCEICKEMNNSNDTWSTFVPSTPLEKRIVKTVNRIEKRESKRVRKKAKKEAVKKDPNSI